jgi:hypothetical protein
VGAPQVNVVPGEGTIPFRTSVGVTRKASPLQIVALMGVIIALGLSSICNVNVRPVQLPVTGVTMYVAVVIVLTVLVRFPEMKFCWEVWVAPPVNPVPVGASQVYRVPAGTRPFVGFTGDAWKVIPAQTVVVIG